MPAKSKSLTDAELAILSLLAEKPMHGYQIEKTIASRGMREWTEIAFSSIYAILEKLRARGWLKNSLETAEGKGPARQVFSLTSAGYSVFRLAALAALESPSRSFSNFQLGLSCLPMLDKKQIRMALQKNLMTLKEKYQELISKQTDQQMALPWHVIVLFEHDLSQLRCEINWLEGFIQTFDSDNDSH